MLELERNGINDFRRRLFGEDPSRLIAFICECGDPACVRTVPLTGEEYLRLRPEPVLHPGHEQSESAA